MKTNVWQHKIAEFVRQAIAASPPFDGMTLDVDENGIHSTVTGNRTWWRVPVIPHPWPKRFTLLYEVFAEIEDVIQHEQGLSIILFPAIATKAVA